MTLLEFLKTEHGPIDFAALVKDCELFTAHPDMPKDEHELRAQLSALVRAGLVTWEGEVVQYVPQVVKTGPSQAQLF